MKRILMLIGFLMVVVAPMLGQVIEVPASWQDLYDNYGVFFATFLGVAGVAAFIGEYVIRLLKSDVDWHKVAIVWVLAIGVSFFGNGVNIGYLAEATWWETIFWGMLSGMAANGIWSSNLLFFKTVVEFLIGMIKSKEGAVG
jgi:hypothetical protein